MIKVDVSGQQGFIMALETLTDSLQVLSGLLQKHYGKKVIVLIDEYDVPLDMAQKAGYYDDMVDLMRNLFGRVLKTNDSLHFAVLTGCLRVAKESFFTGLNNLRVLSVSDAEYDEHFDFTDGEVRTMLEYYGCSGKYELVRTWYDGYRFGDADVYCPWDVINYCAKLRTDPDALPKSFWINTSGNEIIQQFLQKAGQSTRRELEKLIDGESVGKKINQELTYKDLFKSIDNLWSVLFTTGYLTQRGKSEGRVFQLAIPNLEIKEIFIEQILEWFQEEVYRDTPKLDAFCAAFPKADARAVEENFNSYLQRTISIRDTSVRRDMKENFYHEILLGLLSHREDWNINSNAESGDGYSDILVEIEEDQVGIVIEVKYPDSSNLDSGCRKALEQIEKMGYESRLRQDGMKTIIKYGIACAKKNAG